MEDNSENIELLLNQIKDFESLALMTNILFENTFGIQETPLLASRKKMIPRLGNLQFQDEKVDYQFHGNGCKFVFPQGKLVDFNYDSENWKYDGFDKYRFYDFLESKGVSIWNRDDLDHLFIKLEERSIIYRPNPSYAKYRLSPDE